LDQQPNLVRSQESGVSQLLVVGYQFRACNLALRARNGNRMSLGY